MPDCPGHVSRMLTTSCYFDYPTLAAVGHDMLLGSEDDFDAPVNMRLQTDEWAHQLHFGKKSVHFNVGYYVFPSTLAISLER